MGNHAIIPILFDYFLFINKLLKISAALHAVNKGKKRRGEREGERERF